MPFPFRAYVRIQSKYRGCQSFFIIFSFCSLMRLRSVLLFFVGLDGSAPRCEKIAIMFLFFLQYLVFGIWLFVMILEGDQMISLGFLNLSGCLVSRMFVT